MGPSNLLHAVYTSTPCMVTEYFLLQKGDRALEGEGSRSNTARQRKHRKRCVPPVWLNAPLVQDVPWRAVLLGVLSLLGACVGTWLLFQGYQTALGPR